MNKKVLVVMPCYNHADLVSESIESVFAQTYKNFDLICCDDKSSDNTLLVLQKLKEKYNFHLDTNDVNIGTGNTVNKCISLGNSINNYDYICWISSDNLLKENFIESHVNKLSEGFAITYSGWSYIGQNLTRYPETNLIHLKSDFALGPSFMFSKNLFDKAGPFEEGGGEDYYFAVNCALNNAKFGYINENLVAYRVHENSVGGRGPHPTRPWCSARAKEKAQNIILENGFLSYN